MKFSVLMCVYKNDDISHFTEAYKSVLKQTLPPSQIVLVVDGPIPVKLKHAIKDFNNESRENSIEFKTLWLDKNVGHGQARREGVENCKYEVVALVDADDINHIDRFKKQVSYLKKHNDISIVGSQILEIESQTKSPIGERVVPVVHKEIVNYLKTRCPFNQMSVMFRKRDVILAGNYISFFHNEDYYLWIRMYLKGLKFSNLPEVLVYARVNEKFYDRRGGIKYFLSELKIQTLMWREKIISLPRWFVNVIIRFILQVILPPSFRGYLFQFLFRKKTD